MKPIFVCYIEALEPDHIRNIRDSLNEKIGNDYYVLVITHEKYIGISFELFNSKLEEKDFEDLKIKLNLTL